MGKRASMFRCHDCGNDWWEWFEWLGRAELIDFAADLECPECGGQEWELTDSSNFAGGQVSGEAAFPDWMRFAKTVSEAKSVLDVDVLEAGTSETASLVEVLDDRVAALEAELAGGGDGGGT